MKKTLMVLSSIILFLTGCTSTKIKYHEPKYYDFNLSDVELEPIEKLNVKDYVEFKDKSQNYVVMPTWFFVKMLDVNDLRKKHLKIYMKLYSWALEDVERYNLFVEKQRKYFKKINSEK